MEGQSNNTGFNCRRCSLPDSADHLVACDVCHEWEHFQCAGVDDQIKDQSYLCPECSSKQAERGECNRHLKPSVADKTNRSSKSLANKTGSRRGKKSAQPVVTGSVTSSARAAFEAQMKMIEEERQIMERELMKQENLRKQELEEEQRQLDEQRKLMQKEKLLRERKLHESKLFQAKQQLIRQQSMEKKRELLKQLAESSVFEGTIVDPADKVGDWLKTLSVSERGTDESAKTSKAPKSSLSFDPKPHPSPELISSPNPGGPSSRSTVRDVDNSIVQTPANVHSVCISPHQIAARQVMGRELPTFGGHPEDWPIFISSFEQSTLACGYTNAENLIRLQRSLKGHALESVRSRLLLPAGVPHVIQTLQTLYGRPELLIRSLMGKIRQLPSPKHDRLETVMEFGLAVQNLVDHLKAAHQVNHLANPVLMQELIEKLPGPMKLEWAIFKGRYSTVTLETFGDFMSRLVNAASEVTFELPCFGRSSRQDKQKPKEKVFVQTHTTDSSMTAGSHKIDKQVTGKVCNICGLAGHRVVECSKFKGLNMDERWNIVQRKGLCRTCLNNHGKWPCKSWKGCEIDNCRDRHHTLLHSSTMKVSASHINQSIYQSPLFRIIPVMLYGRDAGRTIFAFIDEGSSVSLLEENVAKTLGVKGETEPLTLQWTGNMTRNELRSQLVKIEIAGVGSASQRKHIQARTVKQLVLPKQTMRYRDLAQQFHHLRGLPIDDYAEVQPKLLIGLDNLRLIVPIRLREGKSNEPIAAKCRLGWSVYGYYGNNRVRNATLNFHLGGICDSDRLLNEQLRDYFAIENAGVTIPIENLESEDDKRARKILKETTRRTDSGFETGLLWRVDDPCFPDSYPMALRRLRALEKKLMKNPILMNRVNEIISDYEAKGYAHRATDDELQLIEAKRVWYLPLGIVLHPKKPGKVRLIWDAAAKVNGVSFDSKLLKGPDMLTPLPFVLSRFRQFPVAVCGDIREMFHQIKIRTPDCQSQRFLWRQHCSERPTVFVMDVATFGSTCSPTSAQYIKNLNAQEFAHKYPRAADVIMKSHYVDDLLDSFRTIQEAVEVINEVKLVHSLGGFEIRNFRSNSVKVLKEIGAHPIGDCKDLTLDRRGVTESVLGMSWIPSEDMFTYTFILRDDLQQILEKGRIPTKREVLKVVMSLFDPLGLLSFFLVHGKILIQDCWACGLSWDDPIGDELCERWRRWTNLFPQLSDLRIPRCYFKQPFPSDFSGLQVHIFVDASEVAYSCVAYFRLPVQQGLQVSLIAAKTKVAPLKTLSIPRLELKAAVLGVRLLDSIIKSHTLTISQRFLWTDSSTVLAWIQSDHRKYPKFVAVRVGEILMSSDPQEWRWIPTKMNIADDATKWKSDMNLRSNSQWFRGHSILWEDDANWPAPRKFTTVPEENTPVLLHVTLNTLVDVSRFSSWEKLHRSMAYVIRFIENIRRKQADISLERMALTQAELKSAEEALWKAAQSDGFPTEISILLKTQGPPENRHAVVHKSSSIYKTWPYIDERGILRKRGRINAAPYSSFEAKFPVILPRQHRISFLLADWYHRRFRHANRETVVNEMRQRFEISKLRVLLKKVLNDCVWCRVAQASPRPPPMANLPAFRLTPNVRPFTFTGLDYFGPVFVKVGRSLAKRWIALFTCLTIRAVHIEVVHSLSTESCIMAVRRFVARRGPPAEFHTDNGTCFTGANNELKKEIECRNGALALTFTSAQTRWRFIPPGTPHMGGVWERLVRSIKVAVGFALETSRNPDDETMLTIMLEAEAIEARTESKFFQRHR
ncbi:uncharacterized protein LOC131440034 [Malaya genurostris]|uniref:uncharacterized protein LOC131440034 n=1 Tax=Malaya genurostris TaxID=325434 RepID=UPI0026F40817|nr:uncharacterized protein LOC131440034 [Malaya genurostris]